MFPVSPGIRSLTDTLSLRNGEICFKYRRFWSHFGDCFFSVKTRFAFSFSSSVKRYLFHVCWVFSWLWAVLKNEQIFKVVFQMQQIIKVFGTVLIDNLVLNSDCTCSAVSQLPPKRGFSRIVFLSNHKVAPSFQNWLHDSYRRTPKIE